MNSKTFKKIRSKLAAIALTATAMITSLGFTREEKTDHKDKMIKEPSISNELILDNEIKDHSVALEDQIEIEEESSLVQEVKEEFKPFSSHPHYSGEWVSANALFEVNRCPEDGVIVGRRLHDYKMPDVKKIDNGDGTGKFFFNMECQTCDHEIKLEGNVKYNQAPKPSYGGGSDYDSDDDYDYDTDYNKPVHTHINGPWVSLDDTYEASYCPEDGVLVGTREHKNVDSVSITSNNDGTHKVEKKQTCINCNHVKTEVLNNSCNFGTISYDENNEYETCQDCGYIKNIGKHLMDNGSINYENNTITYKCQHEGCNYSKTLDYKPVVPDKPVHTHYNGEWVSIDDTYEENRCPADGTLMGKREHKYTTSTSITSNNDGTHTIKTEQTCDNCKHEKASTVSSSCSFGKLEADALGEHSTCTVCGYVKETAHSFDNGIVDETNKTITYTCQNDGCGFTKTEEYVPSHTHTLVTNYSGNGDKHTHNKTTSCSTCDYQEKIESENCTPSSTSVSEMKQIDNPTYQHYTETSSTCTLCGEPVIMAESEPELWTITYDSDKKTDVCTSCGRILESHEHVPDDLGPRYRAISGNDYQHEVYYVCNACGEVVVVGNENHTFTEQLEDGWYCSSCYGCFNVEYNPNEQLTTISEKELATLIPETSKLSGGSKIDVNENTVVVPEVTVTPSDTSVVEESKNLEAEIPTQVQGESTEQKNKVKDEVTVESSEEPVVDVVTTPEVSVPTEVVIPEVSDDFVAEETQDQEESSIEVETNVDEDKTISSGEEQTTEDVIIQEVEEMPEAETPELESSDVEETQQQEETSIEVETSVEEVTEDVTAQEVLESTEEIETQDLDGSEIEQEDTSIDKETQELIARTDQEAAELKIRTDAEVVALLEKSNKELAELLAKTDMELAFLRAQEETPMMRVRKLF